jgi:hypothetical protein
MNSEKFRFITARTIIVGNVRNRHHFSSHINFAWKIELFPQELRSYSRRPDCLQGRGGYQQACFNAAQLRVNQRMIPLPRRTNSQ